MNELYIFIGVSLLVVLIVFLSIKFQPNEYLKTFYLMNLVEIAITLLYISVWLFIYFSSAHTGAKKSSLLIYTGAAFIFFWIPSFLVMQLFIKIKGDEWWSAFKNQSQSFPVNI